MAQILFHEINFPEQDAELVGQPGRTTSMNELHCGSCHAHGVRNLLPVQAVVATEPCTETCVSEAREQSLLASVALRVERVNQPD